MSETVTPETMLAGIKNSLDTFASTFSGEYLLIVRYPLDETGKRFKSFEKPAGVFTGRALIKAYMETE